MSEARKIEFPGRRLSDDEVEQGRVELAELRETVLQAEAAEYADLEYREEDDMPTILGAAA
jgi:hypothetical protein